ncbi:MAG: mechanosensitive ion channel [Anaerolineales bacterium]|nr:mechanosensitive ion channel [Anaerolineales bacterium]
MLDEAAGIFRNPADIQFWAIFLIIFTTWLLIQLLRRAVAWALDIAPDRLRFYLLPLEPVLKLVIIVAALLSIGDLLIIPTEENILAAFVAVAIGLGFAFQEYLSSVVAGIVSIYERPYRPGDWVDVEGAYGEVQSLGLRAIKMVTPDDTVVTIPHSKIWGSLVYNNNNGQREHLCVSNFYLHPQHNAATVRQKLYQVAITSPYVQLKLPITVAVAERPWGTHYRVKAYPIDGRDEFRFTSDITVRGKKALENMGVKHVVAPASVAE